MVSMNIKYTILHKKSQMYCIFHFCIQLTASLPQPHPIFDVVVDDEI